MINHNSSSVTEVQSYEQSPDFDPNVEKLAKIVALYESNIEGEQDAAFERAKAFCKARGWTYQEGMEKLSKREMLVTRSPFAGFHWHYEGVNPGNIIKEVRERRDAEKAAIDKYGSIEAVTKLTEQETLYDRTLEQADFDWENVMVDDCFTVVPEAVELVSRVGPALKTISDVFHEMDPSPKTGEYLLLN